MGKATALARGPATLVATTAVTLAAAGAAQAAPEPVYGDAADPGMVRTETGRFVAFTTGGRAPMAMADTAPGPWESGGPALSGLGSWSPGGAVWAPDAWKTPTGWVLYYAAPANGMNGQRCIGVATADHALGPYSPRDTPLVCPNRRLDADDPVPGRPVANAGTIDPSGFRAADGKRYLLYRTQQTPSSLRMVRLGASGTHAIAPSHELRQSRGIIENPMMVQRHRSYVLIASIRGWNSCDYATAWLRSRDRWKFARRDQHVLLDTPGTRICGPGGADVAGAFDGGSRIFLHGWRCKYRSGVRNCDSTADMRHLPSFRAMYAGILGWGSDGATPRLKEFLS